MTKRTKPTHRIDWIKMPVNLLDDERIEELMTTKGVAGLGVYFALINGIYRRKNRFLTESQIKANKLVGATRKTVKEIIEDFHLFTTDKDGHVRSSIDFLGFDDSIKLQSDCNRMSSELQCDDTPMRARVIIDIDKDKEHHLDGDDVSHPDFISQMRMDTSWAAMVMLKSGFASLIRRNWDLALEEFRNHAIVNCSIDNIRSVEDAKKYFHFYVTNSFSGGLLKSALEEHERLQQQNTEYRYEDRNSRAGNRSYHGIAIPDDAPPRPDERAEWNHEQGKWE